MAQVRCIVRDVDAAVAFYATHLGFALKQQFGPNTAILAHEDLTLRVAGPGASASRPMPDGHKCEPGGGNRFVAETKDLAALAARFRVQGAKFRNDIFVGSGGKQILVEDPAGGVVELFEPA